MRPCVVYWRRLATTHTHIGATLDTVGVAAVTVWGFFSQALTALALGTLSDRYGRRPLMLLCVTAQCAGSLGALLVMLFHLDIRW